jgi:hypothetical protein
MVTELIRKTTVNLRKIVQESRQEQLKAKIQAGDVPENALLQRTGTPTRTEEANHLARGIDTISSPQN